VRALFLFLTLTVFLFLSILQTSRAHSRGRWCDVARRISRQVLPHNPQVQVRILLGPTKSGNPDYRAGPISFLVLHALRRGQPIVTRYLRDPP